jgi:dimethylhistidine N-methyltransferase
MLEMLRERLDPRAAFAQDVIAGLSGQQKWLPAKYLYDREGSELFEDICALDEYYPYRAELEILRHHAREMAELIGPEALVIEPGSGLSLKVRALLGHLISPAGYVAAEISPEALLRATQSLQLEFPELPVFPVRADYARGIPLPSAVERLGRRRVVFFPGSTVGNFHPDEAIVFLRELHRLVRHQGALLIGVDQKKDPQILQRAYDDAAGITAAFNLNLLRRMNRELQGNFQPKNFAHLAVYNDTEGRVEMHLESLVPQIVSVAGRSFRFRAGETIHTENSYKYSVPEFKALAAEARFSCRKLWQDSGERFAAYFLIARG